MPRDFRASENQKIAKAKRAEALRRIELRYPTAPRVSADGATSMAVKAEDPALRAAIDAVLLARRRA